MYKSLKDIVDGMPKPIYKGKRTFTLEELILKLAGLGSLSDGQIEAITLTANLSCCQPPFTSVHIAYIVRRGLRYFRSANYQNHIPRIEWNI